MKLFPTEFEVYVEGDTDIMAKFKAFDEESLSITIDDMIMSVDDLREIVNLFEQAQNMLRDGVEDK